MPQLFLSNLFAAWRIVTFQ